MSPTATSKPDSKQWWNYSAINTLENIMHADTGDTERGQNLARFYQQTQGNLIKAAESIASKESPVARIITGFYIEKMGAAETDGISSAVQMAYFFKLAGIECNITTDKYCAAICRAALAEVGCADMLEVVEAPDDKTVEEHLKKWNHQQVTHVISIERPGPSLSDNRPYNMKGELIENCYPLHRLFSRGNWQKIGIVDRGNEIGSGSLPAYMIAEDIYNGEQIACKTGADYLLVARVSNWAANALTAAIAILGPNEWPNHLRQALNDNLQENILKTMAKSGAVDGITYARRPNRPTVDALPMSKHTEMVKALLDTTGHAVGGRGMLKLSVA
ncbi:MAG: DUF4392 domain-containing protein [Alphaproteobacteria bacterium]|nr:DUF4392 domain-containing protein [Alphaproteobacteria bacterium]